MSQRWAALALAFTLATSPAITLLGAANPEPPGPSGLWTHAGGSWVDALAAETGADTEAASSSAAGPVLSQWMRSPACPVRDSFDVVAVEPCATPPPTPALTCDDGSAPVDPLWHRERATGTGPWGPWDLVTGSWCTVAAGPTPEMVLTELRRLPLPAPALTVCQPAGLDDGMN